jgi:hypothetical protein
MECAMIGGLPVSNRHLGFPLGTVCRYEALLLGADIYQFYNLLINPYK